MGPYNKCHARLFSKIVDQVWERTYGQVNSSACNLVWAKCSDPVWGLVSNRVWINVGDAILRV